MPLSHKNPVLVLAPHPDDETFGCGGTIRMLSEGGVPVDVAFLTRGEMGLEPGELPSPEARRNLAETRTQEARAACEVLGVRNVLFLGGHDTRLADQPELGEEIARLLRSGEYQRVFCPWPQDAHDDHQATFNLLRGRRQSQSFHQQLLAVRGLEAAAGEYVRPHRSHDRGQAAGHGPVSKPVVAAQLSRRLCRAVGLSQPVLPLVELCRGLSGLR